MNLVTPKISIKTPHCFNNKTTRNQFYTKAKMLTASTLWWNCVNLCIKQSKINFQMNPIITNTKLICYKIKCGSLLKGRSLLVYKTFKFKTSRLASILTIRKTAHLTSRLSPIKEIELIKFSSCLKNKNLSRKKQLIKYWAQTLFRAWKNGLTLMKTFHKFKWLGHSNRPTNQPINEY